VIKDREMSGRVIYTAFVVKGIVIMVVGVEERYTEV
jgi:hypothetical protein